MCIKEPSNPSDRSAVARNKNEIIMNIFQESSPKFVHFS